MPIADIGDIAGSPILGTILAAVAIWVSLWLYRRQRTRRSLAYEANVIELVSVHQAAKGRIKVLFDEEEIGRVHLVEVRIENTGNVPVTPGDFQQDIVIDLGRGATALTADVNEVTPEDLRVDASPHGNQIEIKPLLLNPGDSLTLKVFARNFHGKVECHYRIVGIPKMDDAAVQRQRRQASLARWSGATGGLASLLLGLAAIVLVGTPAAILGRSQSEKTNSVVTTWGGERLCGQVLSTSDRRIVVQAGDQGIIRAIPLGDVKSIKDDSC